MDATSQTYHSLPHISAHPIPSKESAYLWCLSLDLSGTSEGTVNFTHVDLMGSCLQRRLISFFPDH